MSVDVALQISFDAMRAANDRINNLDHESIIWATEHPDRARGWLEAYMVRARARDASILSPLPPLK
jgi:xylose isomerase